MTREAMRQPDQDPALWDRHVAAYEAVFEPLTDDFAAGAFAALAPLAGARLLDLCAGAGGAALMAARLGAEVTAVDGSAAMVARIRRRADGAALAITAEVADAAALALPERSFDRVLSCFDIVLLPDPARALRAIHRALAPGGRVAVVTWTEPTSYELASRLGAAIAAARPPGATRAGPPAAPGPLPAQLRYADPAALLALMAEGGFPSAEVVRLEARLHASSAEALAHTLAFAPGLDALLTGLGPERGAVETAFARTLEADQGFGPVSLGAVAHLAVAQVAVARRPVSRRPRRSEQGPHGVTALPTPAAAIAIICKVPTPGLSKTRLIPHIGAARAADLSRAFLTDLAATIERVGNRIGARGYAVCSPADAAVELARFLPSSFGYAVHTDPVLGTVLDAAMADLLGRGHDCAILVNGDSPTLPEPVLEAAVAALRRPGERAVFGPALDGGYTLVGLKQRAPGLFADIAWSTPDVMAQSRARAVAIGLAVEEVAPWYDIDDAVSFGWLRDEMAGYAPAGLSSPGAPAPATRAVIEAGDRAGTKP